MAIKNTDIKLKGHGSFYLREGWIRKGLVAVGNETFSKEKSETIDDLGVGSNMVLSIKYWLKALGIAVDKKGSNNKNYLRFTETIGELINKYDSYLEDIGSLAILHYKLANNFKLATSWSIIFNDMNTKEFTKRDAEEFIGQELTRRGYIDFPLASIESDVQCFLKSYLKSIDEKNSSLNPEENNICPLADLNLIDKKILKNGQIIYEKQKIKKNNLDKLIFLYIILDKTREKGIEGTHTTIDNLLNENGNVGKVFNLDLNSINEYLDVLSSEKYIKVVRTAGLNQIYFDEKELNEKMILEEYYTKNI